MRLKVRNIPSYRIAVLALALCAAITAGAAEQTQIQTLPASAHQTVRLLLTRPGFDDRADIQIEGVYKVQNDYGLTAIYPRGSELTVTVTAGQMLVHYQGMSINAGNAIDFIRCDAGGNAVNGLKLAGGSNLYEGDLYLTLYGGSIRAVAHIQMEDYLTGVVPYEMSDRFPIEALKAQAVAARTYAAGRLNANRDYDLVDNTNDQVYMGRNASNTQSLRAIQETRGMIGWYHDAPAQCYYSASNGGQTEKISHVWGGQDLPYLTYAQDTYDVANPASVVKHYRIDKLSPYFSEAALTLMLPQLQSVLAQNGFIPRADLLRIDKAENITLGKPKYNDGSMIMTELSMDVIISGKYRLDVPPSDEPAGTEDDTEFLLHTTDTPMPALTQEEAYNIDAGDRADPEVTEVPIYYSGFIAVTEPVHLTLPLFPALSKALGLSINNSDNEIITLEETDTGYILYARRYGHGVGMSQRGAEQMAGREGKTWHEILDFYYPGMELRQFTESSVILPVLDPERLEAPGPRATPTPRPTLMPVTGALPPGAWYAKVTEIADDSWLNLRSEPHTSSDILMRLYKHQILVVLERCQEEGFVKVKTDTAEGYVMESFLTQTE
jgi:peptidoglycan hydrolase-like amidase